MSHDDNNNNNIIIYFTESDWSFNVQLNKQRE